MLFYFIRNFQKIDEDEFDQRIQTICPEGEPG